MPEGGEKRILETLEKVEEMVRFEELKNPTLLSRSKGVGILNLDDAVRLGATGPVIRGSGMVMDVRRDEPYEVYDKLDFEVPVRTEGDACARYLIGIEEMKQSVKIVRQAIAALPEGEVIVPELQKLKLNVKIPEGEVYVRNEVSRGEAAMHMVSNGSKNPYRVKVRGPDFLHMIPVLEHLLEGAQIADVPAIYWSLNICPADMDR